MRVNLGICNFCVPGTGIFAAKYVSEAGLDGMSLEFGSYEKGFPLSLRKVQDEYLSEQQKYGIAYPNIGLSAFDDIPFHASRDNSFYEIVRTMLKKAVNTAAYMGIPQILVPSFGVSEIKNDRDFVHAAQTFQYLCELAEEKNILISSENILNAGQQRDLADAVGRENFRLFYDSQNLYHNRGYRQAVMLEELYGMFGSQLHVKDGKTGILSGNLLGDGDSDFEGTIRVLKRRSYEGWIILENLYENLQFCRQYDGDAFQWFYEDVKRLKRAVTE